MTDAKDLQERGLDLEAFRGMLQDLDEGFIVADASGKIVLFSDRARQIIGPVIETPPENWSAEYGIFHDDRDELIPGDDLPLFRAIAGHATKRREMRVRNQDSDSVVTVEVCGHPLRNSQGELVGGAVLVRDISAEKIRTVELEQARDTADEASRAKSEFLANMSHEIRTPMNGIVATLDLLQDSVLSADQLEHLHIIRRSTDNLSAIINDILDFSKIEAGSLLLEQVIFDLNDTLRGVKSLYATTAANKGITFRVLAESDVAPYLVGDPTRLSQILNNLVNNAIKFTAEGSVELLVMTSAESTHSVAHLRFEVRDTGRGIPDAQYDKIFQPFTQADGSTTRNFGGTGLGLTICRQIVEAMDGTIGFETNASQGTTFWFELPLCIAAVKPTVAARPAALANTASGLVLVAEDNEINQIVSRSVLEKLGYQVEIAVDGYDAIERVEQGEYVAILMDCQMPRMGGIEATRVIRQRFPDMTTPIIAMTAQAYPGDRQKCLDAGMDDYLAKPLTINDLAETLGVWTSAHDNRPAEPDAPAEAAELGAVSNPVPDTDPPIHETQDTADSAVEAPASEPEPPSIDPSAASRTQVPGSSYIDFAALDRLREQTYDGESDLVPELVEAFMEQVPQSLEVLKSAKEKDDAEQIHREAHRLCSTTANLGATAMTELCTSLELLGKVGSVEGAGSILLALLDAYDHSVVGLQHYLTLPVER